MNNSLKTIKIKNILKAAQSILALEISPNETFFL